MSEPPSNEVAIRVLLTPRHLHIVKLLVQGQTNQDIADHLTTQT